MTEFENENSYRNYPFAGTAEIRSDDGVEFPSDVFVDALLYPVNPSGRMKLDEFVPSENRFSFSDENNENRVDGVIVGNRGDLTQDGRPAGTVVFGSGLKREVGSGRKWSFSNLWVSSRCVVPVPGPVVFDIEFEGQNVKTVGGFVTVRGEKRLKAIGGSKTIDGVEYQTMRFDFKQKSTREETDKDDKLYIKSIVIVRKPGSMLDFTGGGLYSPGSIPVTCCAHLFLRGLSREDICFQANREEAVSKVFDTCVGGDSDIPDICPVVEDDPETRDKVRSVYDMHVFLTTGDYIGWRNALKITPINGSIEPNTPRVRPSMKYDEAQEEVGKLTRSQLGYGNGIRIEVTGVGVQV